MPEYVRRKAKGHWLSYHDSRCRHVTGREDLVPVSAAEVVRAHEKGAYTRVTHEGETRYLVVCRMCIPRAPDWPPDA